MHISFLVLKKKRASFLFPPRFQFCSVPDLEAIDVPLAEKETCKQIEEID
jgi:hypothetical protein